MPKSEASPTANTAKYSDEWKTVTSSKELVNGIEFEAIAAVGCHKCDSSNLFAPAKYCPLSSSGDKCEVNDSSSHATLVTNAASQRAPCPCYNGGQCLVIPDSGRHVCKCETHIIRPWKPCLRV